MKRRITSLFLAVVTLLTMCTPAFAITEPNNITEIIEADGTRVSSSVRETEEEYIVEVYINGQLDQRATTDKETGEGTLVLFGDVAPRSNNRTFYEIAYNLSDFVSPVPNSGIALLGEIEETSSYSIRDSYRTDYVYQGDILYGDTRTKAYESGSRYYGETLNFSAGDAVSLLISAILIFFTGETTPTITALLNLGFPVAGGKITDSFTKQVYYTHFTIATRVYFDDIYTANVSREYDKVLVSVDPVEQQQGGDGLHFSDDYYDYDIVDSFASYAVSASALAFSDKYITLHNPNLRLPITTIPYTGI